MWPNYLLFKVIGFDELVHDHFHAEWCNYDQHWEYCEMCGTYALISEVYNNVLVNNICFECYLKPDLRQLINKHIQINRADAQISCLTEHDTWKELCHLCDEYNCAKYYVDALDFSSRYMICAECIRDRL